MAPPWARPRSRTTTQPGERWPARADLTLAGLGLPCPQTLGDRVLARVDGDEDAGLLAGEAALARLAAALRRVRVVDAGPVYPGAVARHDAPLVARHRGERPVAPLEGGPVAHAARPGGAAQRHVVPHRADEAGPRRQAGPRALEDGARGEASLAPHERRPHRRRPDGSRPSHRGDGPHLGHAGSGLKSPAASAKVPKPGSPRQARSSSAAERGAGPSASRDAARAERGFSPFISVCPVRPDARPAGPSPNDGPGGRLGEFIVWRGHDGTGAWRTSNHHLSS